MARPIPLRCFVNGGTGFLVSSDDKTWLVTCVHIVTGAVINTTDARQFDGASLGVVGTDIVIPLVVSGQQAFVAVVDPGRQDRLLDVMAVPLSGEQLSALGKFGSYHLDTVRDVHIDEEVSAVGYAGISLLVEPTTSPLEGRVIKANIARFVINAPSSKGLSGAAVTSKDGLVGILYGDEGSDEALTAAVCVRLAAVKSALFG